MAPQATAQATGLLEARFSDLDRWVDKWSLETEAERFAHRVHADYADITAFYEALAPRMDEIIDHLNTAPLDGLSAEQKRLYHLAQSFFEAAVAVEMLQEPDEATMLPPERMRIDIDGGAL